MSLIKVKLFNTPCVMRDNEKIKFPFMKAEALFYYLLVNKQATRDELVSLFWGESGDKIAKKNLRNAMYKIRKAFDMDIIISPQKSTVILNPDIEIESDLELLLCGKRDFIEIYEGEFLKGFGVKRAEGFENWLFNKRQYYKDIYLSRIYNSIDISFNEKDLDKVKKFAKLILNEDEFDERPYRILMNVYREQGTYNKAIELYDRLENTLDKELGIKPDLKTQNIIKDIKRIYKVKEPMLDRRPQELFYGREKEISFLKKNFRLFMDNKGYMSVFIKGEAGIGKTKLKDEFYRSIEKENVYIFETNCYQAEKHYFLKPWNDILSELSIIIEENTIKIPLTWRKMISYIFPSFYNEEMIDKKNPVEVLDTLKFSVIEEAIQGVFKRVVEKRKIILIFEDMQWIDDLSLSLLSTIIHRNHNIMLLSTCRNVHYERIDQFITMLRSHNLLEVIKLHRFTKDEMDDFIHKYFKGPTIKKRTKEIIYKETEGNTFFLMEYLNMIKEKGDLENVISPKMKDILKSKFIDISQEGKKLLNIGAMFFDKVTLKMIKELSGKDEFEIIEIMEELHNKYIIYEIGGEEISYKFTHQKLREYVYYSLSSAKRRILHNKIGDITLKSLRNDKRDVAIYPKLIYHYSNAGNTLNTLKYMIKYLDVYLDIKHELFPIISYVDFKEPNFKNMSIKKVLDYFNDIEELFTKLKDIEVDIEEVITLEIGYLHIKGRYLIREGEYKQGNKNIEEMIDKALSIKSFKYALKGYRQNIYYGIQVHDIFFMEDNIDKGLKIAYAHNLDEDIGIFLRLKGLNKIMMEAYDEAEKLLAESIKTFTNINNDSKYSLNIAACYNYIGEIRRHRMEFSKALNYYDKAMKICEEKKLLRGLTIFNTNAGQAAFEKGDYLRAKEYLKRAIIIYGQIDTLWGRSTAEGFMALIKCKEGKYDLALEHLKNAEYYSGKLKSPLEIGIVYRVKAEIKANMKGNESLNKVFSKYLDLSIKKYCDMGIKHLMEVKEGYEIGILKILSK